MSGPHANGSQAPSLKQGPHGFVLEHREPLFGLYYGDSNTGKSTDLVYTFPNGFYVGPPGGVTKIGVGVVGWLPKHDEGSIDTLEKLIVQLPAIQRLGCDALIIDDLSVIAEKTVRTSRPAFPSSGDGRFKLWQHVADCLFTLRDHCRALSIHVAANAHPMGAWTDEGGVRWKGGPWFPGRLAPIHFPPVTDQVLRAKKELLPDQLPEEWPAVYANDTLDQDWYSKDRLDVCWAKTPMNLREILTAGRYKLSRAPGLEWQDEVVEAVARFVAQGNAFQAVWAWAVGAYLAPRIAQYPAELQRQVTLWTRRDARARIAIRMQRAQRSRDIGLTA